MSVEEEDEIDSRSTKELVDFLETADEWSNVAEIVPTYKENNEGSVVRNNIDDQFSSPVTTIETIIQYLNSGVLEPYLSQVEERPKTTWDLFYSCICSRPRLPPDIENTKQTILATALISFNNEEPLHLCMLRTLYKQLTGALVDCPRYGHHWEDIGFQGNDPATDLRGVGILGLVNAVYLVVTPRMLPFARTVHALSTKESQEFPLMVLSLNVTRICLHILRDGLLDTRAFVDKDVWTSFNYMYASVMYHIYHIWKTQHKTISNSGFVLQDAEEAARKSPERMMQEFSAYLSEL
eukprot:TRINITY_DN6701_c0_g1_i1.p1 TRINITY_DN6701_c0_g1~~TRINITY_DN6701_c0_g1_i1.p1  ORF type:complete len:310 (-),score=29.40 TRINITY_DN6701_c0_g1_i1:739-1623(-)